MSIRVAQGVCFVLCVVAPLVLAAAVVADDEKQDRWSPMLQTVRSVDNVQVSLEPTGGVPPGGIAGTCPEEISTHTNADFEPGTYILLAGMGEGESAVVSYTLTPADFPLKIERCECLIGTLGATVETETKWSFLVWEGFPDTGTLKYVFTSDGIIQPHITMPPGSSSVNIQVSVDPTDPEQMIINDDGSSTFSIGYRIDEHNNQTQSPCLVPPPSTSNAFFMADTDGVASMTGNWLGAIDCGIFGCPAGFTSFQDLPGSPGNLCTPSGDWVMRATWKPFFCEPTGACCVDQVCQTLSEGDCALAGGVYQGDGVSCGITFCEDPVIPCCFQGTGGCLDLTENECLFVGGVPGEPGQVCIEITCFPTGSCCLPDGSCSDGLSPEQCAAEGGLFQGDGVLCADVVCPEPTGAACFENGACLEGLTQGQAESVGATWGGAGSTCLDSDNDGSADICSDTSNPADLNGDGFVGAEDLTILLSLWGKKDVIADLNGDGFVGAQDLTELLTAWGAI